MASNIDPTFPVSSIDQPSQGFRDNFSAAKIEIEELQSLKVNISGSTMTGPLLLSGAPVMALEASTKQYVDDEIIALDLSLSTQLSGKLSLTGGIMAGSLILGGDPISGLQAATKQYVDNEIIANPGGLLNIVEDITPQLGADLDVQTFQIMTSANNADIKLNPNGSGTVNVSNFNITNVGDPTDDQDAATKLYVDEEIAANSGGPQVIFTENNPALGEDNSPAIGGIGFNWANPTNIQSEGLSYAGMVTSGGTPYVLPYLRGSDFGFELPLDAVIQGIEAVIYYANHVGTAYVEDVVRIAWGASASNLSTTNKANGTAPPIGVENSYGGPSDLWGENAATLTPAVINSTDFGLVLKVGRNSGSFGRTIGVAYFRLEITYSTAAVIPGSYTNADITVNAQGQLTAAANGTALQDVVDDTSPQLGGELDAASFKITNVDTPTVDGDAANKLYVDTEVSNVSSGIASVSEDTMPALGGNLNVGAFTITTGTMDGNITLVPNGTGDIDASSSKIINLVNPTLPQEAATKFYVDDQISVSVGLQNIVEDITPQLGANLDTQAFGITTSVVNGNVTLIPNGAGAVHVSDSKITGLTDPTTDQEAATKKYVDDEVLAASTGLQDVIDDTSPQLGGNLDTLTRFITTSTVNGDILFNPNGTGGISFGNAVLKGVDAPVAFNDAATKNYVDGLAGIQDVIDDTSPQLGGTFDTLNQSITSTTGNINFYSNTGGHIDVTNLKILNLGAPTANADATTKLYVDTEIANNVSNGLADVVDDASPQLGGNLDVGIRNIFTASLNNSITLVPNGLGTVDVSSKRITSLGTPTAGTDATTKTYVDDEITNATGSLTAMENLIDDSTPQLGGNLDVLTRSITTTTSNGNVLLNPNGTGTVDVSASRITTVAEPTAATDAATKNYVDTAPPSTSGLVEELNYSAAVPVDGQTWIIRRANYAHSTGTFYYSMGGNGSMTVTMYKNGVSLGAIAVSGDGAGGTVLQQTNKATSLIIGDNLEMRITSSSSTNFFGFTWVTTRA